MHYLFLFLILALPFVSAQESLQGLEQGSPEEIQYTACVENCGKCETNCKDSVLQEAARNKLDISFCDQLENVNLKMICQDDVNTLLAITQKDDSYCEKLSDPSAVNGCKNSITTAKAVEAKDASLCSQESCRISVYTSLASANQDPLFCENILDELAKANCKANTLGSGETTAVVPATEEAQQKPLGKKTKFIILGSLLGLVLILLILFFILRRGRKGDSLQNEDALKQRFAQLHQAQPVMKK